MPKRRRRSKRIQKRKKKCTKPSAKEPTKTTTKRTSSTYRVISKKGIRARAGKGEYKRRKKNYFRFKNMQKARQNNKKNIYADASTNIVENTTDDTKQTESISNIKQTISQKQIRAFAPITPIISHRKTSLRSSSNTQNTNTTNSTNDDSIIINRNAFMSNILPLIQCPLCTSSVTCNLSAVGDITLVCNNVDDCMWHFVSQAQARVKIGNRVRGVPANKYLSAFIAIFNGIIFEKYNQFCKSHGFPAICSDVWNTLIRRECYETVVKVFTNLRQSVKNKVRTTFPDK